MRRALPLAVAFSLAIVSAGCGGSDAGETTESVDQAAKVCAAGPTIEGVDVSHYDASIDWPSVKAAGVVFTIAKATETTDYVDATFSTNRANAEAAGVAVGAYHFFRADADPVAQAQHFVDTIGNIAPGELSPVIDLETTDGQSATTISSRAATFLQQVEALTGRIPMIYTSPSFYTSTLGSPPELAAYPLWIANWQTTCPTVPDPWSDWTLWQYTDSGSVSGITTAVDRDQFDGTIEDLKCVGVKCATGQCVAGTCSGGNTGGSGGSGGGGATGGSGGAAGSGGQAGAVASGGASTKTKVVADDGGGCGCRTPRGSTPARAGLALLLLSAATLRRRRKKQRAADPST